jgi:hypothetical protein
MRISSVTRTILVLVACLASACAVSDTGLGPARDASSTTICPAGLTDQASWPAGPQSASCTKPCGPDEIGSETCGQTDRTTCQTSSGCVCLDAPCVACANCVFQTISDCYVPTNAVSAPACSKDVTQGGACSPACGRTLCLEADGKTGCVCNAQGKYACARWGETTWK